MVKREIYLRKIRSFYDSEFIKVLIGMRRVGKSTLMKQIINELKSDGISEKRIIYINFELLSFEELMDYKKLNEYLQNKIKTEDKHYIFIDEIQNVKFFEKVINSINNEFNVSIFITGSNSNLLSGELATLLSGRYREFKVYPFSYNEWLESINLNHSDELLLKYLKFGSIPQISLVNDEDEKIEILNDVFNSIIYKDIIARAQVKDVDLLKKIIIYISQNTSEIISINSIVKYLANTAKLNSTDTIYKYLDLLLNSLLFQECKQFDLKGKKILKKLNKFYVNDLGLNRISTRVDIIDYSKIVETVVYNHLKFLGYEISYGKNGDYEIDFVITKIRANGLDKKYIQVSYLLETSETIEREYRAFTKIDDHFPKYIITMDKVSMSKDGVNHIELGDFLQNDDF